MKAVWSFWSKPYLARRGSLWLEERHHWLSWILSFETARKHYPETMLVTDEVGASILAESIGLGFSEVSTELEALASADPAWWALGKLQAYRAQQIPFVHVDADVYLWKRLPSVVECAPVLAQSPEEIRYWPGYEPKRIVRVLSDAGGWLPEAWRWYAHSGREQVASCCGILGGRDVELLCDYASLAMRLIRDPLNTAGWAQLNDASTHMVTVEQYFLNACLEHRRFHAPAAGRPAYLRCLFAGEREPYQAASARRMGYTHLIGGAKQNASVLGRLERVVRRDYPGLYQKCIDYVSRVTDGCSQPNPSPLDPG